MIYKNEQKNTRLYVLLIMMLFTNSSTALTNYGYLPIGARHSGDSSSIVTGSQLYSSILDNDDSASVGTSYYINSAGTIAGSDGSFRTITSANHKIPDTTYIQMSSGTFVGEDGSYIIKSGNIYTGNDIFCTEHNKHLYCY